MSEKGLFHLGWLEKHCPKLYLYLASGIVFLYCPDSVLTEGNNTALSRLGVRVFSPILALIFVGLDTKKEE